MMHIPMILCQAYWLNSIDWIFCFYKAFDFSAEIILVLIIIISALLFALGVAQHSYLFVIIQLLRPLNATALSD